MAGLSVVVLAAGKGKRMQSDRPKVLQPLAGRPLLAHVLETVQRLGAEQDLVVIGHQAEQIRAAFARHPSVQWVEQTEQLGTGHAVAQALPAVADEQMLLVLYGDVPLVPVATLESLLAQAQHSGLALLSVALDNPSGYGRVLRNADGQVVRIVEQKDATLAEQAITEVNTGILAARAVDLRRWVGQLDRNNAQGEYYLTDCIALAVQEGGAVRAVLASDPLSVQGVNDRAQLAELERAYQWQQAQALLTAGATLADPARIDVRGSVSIGRDVFIDVGVIFEGEVELGDRVQIGPYCVIRNSRIAADSEILAYSHLDSAQVGEQAHVGPYARLRPGAQLAQQARVGNFVEIKQAQLGVGAKVNHLTYIGDAEIGPEVNVGAGTITCNYDGVNKSKTVIEQGAFIGSNTALVAPVRIGARATVGAGSTISQDVPAESLVLTRAERKVREHWPRPEKKAK